MAPKVENGGMKELRNELEAIAGDELGDVLESWGNLSQDQAKRLSQYLDAEMGEGGLLSPEQLRESGAPVTAIRKSIRAILRNV